MNKYPFFLLPVVTLFFFLNNDHRKKKHMPVPGGISRWTGTVTYEEITNISNAAYTATAERHITANFTNALPTMYRDDETTDLNFTDDKGSRHPYLSQRRPIYRRH
jgi:hypothetical protein